MLRRRPPSDSGPNSPTLFQAAAQKREGGDGKAPLASRMRPKSLDDFLGQTHVLGKELSSPLAQAVLSDRVRSLILWGPPGSGKTTLAQIVAANTKAHFVPFNAVMGSVAELRIIVAAAKERLLYRGERTTVFVDEIHRFNKSQQDAFLPSVESGEIVMIGATTENPSFAVNGALLSRCKVIHLAPLADADIVTLLRRALADSENGVAQAGLEVNDEALAEIAKLAGGDARRALTTLENLSDYAATTGVREVSLETVRHVEGHRPLTYDKSGEEHYNVISAFIKSMRGSDPDAAVYWMMRMVEAGDDPLFILRRMLIFASEDIGNADPRALLIANGADQAFRRLGMPEGLYAMGQAAVYLACSPKSNASNVAWHRAKELIDAHGALPVPNKLRNAVTKLMKEEGYGEGYKYAHNFDGGVATGETYLPDALVGERLYEPTNRGEEVRIKARLEAIRAGLSPERPPPPTEKPREP